MKVIMSGAHSTIVGEFVVDDDGKLVRVKETKEGEDSPETTTPTQAIANKE